jgi:hypothetical protein
MASDIERYLSLRKPLGLSAFIDASVCGLLSSARSSIQCRPAAILPFRIG